MSNRSLLVPSLTASILLAGTLAPGAGAQSATPDRAARALAAMEAGDA